MELSYWQSRWRKNKIGFHLPEGYPGLQKYWHHLDITDHPVVLVPLCGKSIDMVWMEEQGGTVIGVEISEKAILDFLDENNREYKTNTFANFTIYQTGKIHLWCGDFMKLPKHKLPKINLIFDKGALIALPPKMRISYFYKIKELAGNSTKILLQHFEYPQNQMPGPPFSVSEEEIENAFKATFSIHLLESNNIKPETFPKFQRRGLNSIIVEQLLFLEPKLP
ncbi:MAG: thiopurine S-methyltransferase [Balneolaceae bacterium]